MKNDRFFRLSMDLMAVTGTLDGTWKRVNPAFETILGWSESDLLGKPFLALVHLEDLAQTESATAELAAGNSIEKLEHRLKCKDGGYRWIAWNTVPYPAEGLVYCLGHDITNRRDSEAILKESELRFRSLADAMPQLVWIADRDGRVTYYNRHVLQYQGVKKTAKDLWEWLPIVHPLELQATAKAWESAVRTGKTYECEHRVLMADGNYHWHLSLAVREPEKPFRWFGTATDIQEVKQAQETLLESDKRKDEFIATLAHELRNPLAPIRTGLQVLRLSGNDAVAAEKSLAIMERQIAQLMRLIDDLLDISRITSGKLNVQRERVDLRDVIQNAIEASRPWIDQERHELSVTLPEGPLILSADPIRLSQAFSNLLSNASRYTPEGGHIVLEAKRHDNQISVSISDDGIGIADSMLERVFDMFWQIEPSFKKSYSGLGIGLPLAKSLVEMHGGRVSVQSDGLGRGSVFTVHLPCFEEETVESGLEQQGPEQPSPQAKTRVLVVDDNEDAADLLSLSLEIQGYQVEVAHDGIEALEMGSILRPNAVIMDLGMPRMDGFEAARRMRTETWGKTMTLIALTGWGQEADRRKTRECGFDHHLVKPADPASVEELLRVPES